MGSLAFRVEFAKLLVWYLWFMAFKNNLLKTGAQSTILEIFYLCNIVYIHVYIYRTKMIMGLQKKWQLHTFLLY